AVAKAARSLSAATNSSQGCPPDWREVDVVRRRIAVSDVDILLRHNSEDMRFVMTTVLIQRGGRAGHIEGPITNLRVIGQCSILNINKRISNLPVFDGPLFRRQVRALGGTSRVGRGVDLFRLRRRT